MFFKDLERFSMIYMYKKYYKNHIYVYLFNNIKKILFLFKSLFNNSFVSLIEITGVDITNLKNYNFFFFQEFKQNFIFERIIIYNLINYKNNFRVFFNLFYKNNLKLYSLDNFFLNSNWLERELIEFFGIKVLNKKDTRNLLLDYNLTINPLLKNFPTEGFQELYFNYGTFNLDYFNNEFVEL